MGGMVNAIERGFPQAEIADAAYQLQQAIERKEQIIVGVNEFVQSNDPPIEILYIDDRAADRQLGKLEALRQTRDNERVRRAIDRLRVGASTNENLMPAILEAVRAYATLGEMCDALRDVWGEYEEAAAI
jgi:methylmalonyl-CoA mutase N-terminal domain/subunit